MANSAGLIGDQNGAYRPSVVPVHRKEGDGQQQPDDVAFLRCQKSQERPVLRSAMTVARVDGVVVHACLVHVIPPVNLTRSS